MGILFAVGITRSSEAEVSDKEKSWKEWIGK